MRKLVLFNMITLDGYFEGPNRNIAWHNVDAEFNEFAVQQLSELDLLVFGRVTYELMAGHWPTPTALRNDPVVAERMNSIAKVVASRTLTKVGWNNARLLRGDVVVEMKRIKQEPGREIAVFGSANLAATLIQLGLIDEYRIMVNPLILGAGVPLFNGVHRSIKMSLLESRGFRSGNVLLRYRPAPT